MSFLYVTSEILRNSHYLSYFVLIAIANEYTIVMRAVTIAVVSPFFVLLLGAAKRFNKWRD